MRNQFRISQAFTVERNAIFPGFGLDCILLNYFLGGQHDIAVFTPVSMLCRYMPTLHAILAHRFGTLMERGPRSSDGDFFGLN